MASLMNLWAPVGNQGVIYGLETSVNAAARSVAPMIAAAIAVWFGLRGVFGATTFIYMAMVLLALQILRNRAEATPAPEIEAQAVGDN